VRISIALILYALGASGFAGPKILSYSAPAAVIVSVTHFGSGIFAYGLTSRMLDPGSGDRLRPRDSACRQIDRPRRISDVAEKANRDAARYEVTEADLELDAGFVDLKGRHPVAARHRGR
jgi:hypothetical protein